MSLCLTADRILSSSDNKRAFILLLYLRIKDHPDYSFRTTYSFLVARESLRVAIDQTWDEAWKPGNITTQVNWQLVFHSLRKPSVDEFIVGLMREMEIGKTPPSLL